MYKFWKTKKFWVALVGLLVGWEIIKPDVAPSVLEVISTVFGEN